MFGIHPRKPDMRDNGVMTPYRHIEPIAPYATQDDPWWWCEPCASGDHANHADVYDDIFGDEAACVCPDDAHG